MRRIGCAATRASSHTLSHVGPLRRSGHAPGRGYSPPPGSSCHQPTEVSSQIPSPSAARMSRVDEPVDTEFRVVRAVPQDILGADHPPLLLPGDPSLNPQVNQPLNALEMPPPAL